MKNEILLKIDNLEIEIKYLKDIERKGNQYSYHKMLQHLKQFI